jgi:hypothetical protein
MGNNPASSRDFHCTYTRGGKGKPVHAGTAGSLNFFILQPANTSNIDEDTPGLWTMAILNDPTSGASPPSTPVPLLRRYCLRHGSGHSLPIPAPTVCSKSELLFSATLFPSWQASASKCRGIHGPIRTRTCDVIASDVFPQIMQDAVQLQH